MTGTTRHPAGGPPPEILRRGSGYDAEPPVALRSQVLRRRPTAPAPDTDTTSTHEADEGPRTEDFPRTDPDTGESTAGDTTYTDTEAGARRRLRRSPAVSAEARRARREARLARRRAEMAASSEVAAASAVGTPTQFHADEPGAINASHDETTATAWSVAEDIDRDDPAVAANRLGPLRRAVARTAQHRWLLVVVAALAVAVAALLWIAFSVKGLVGGDGDGITDPVATMDTPDPFSDAVECPSSSEGSTTTGRDPGDLTTGPNVIKAFNYAYFHWRSGPAARALTASNVEGIGSAVDLQSSIDALNPQARYCLSITETGANAYRVEVTLILPDGTRDPDPDVQKITTTDIGERTYIASVTRDKK